MNALKILLPCVLSSAVFGKTQTVTVPIDIVAPINAKEEWQKIKDKLRGKDRQPSGEANSAATCKPSEHMSVEIRPPNPEFQPEVILRNKTAKMVVAVADVDQHAGGGKVQTISVQSNPISANSWSMIQYGTGARIKSCQFVQ